MQSNRGFVAVDEPGPHVLNLWMREDGFEIDKIVLTPDAKYRPEGFGPDESPR